MCVVAEELVLGYDQIPRTSFRPQVKWKEKYRLGAKDSLQTTHAPGQVLRKGLQCELDRPGGHLAQQKEFVPVTRSRKQQSARSRAAQTEALCVLIGCGMLTDSTQSSMGAQRWTLACNDVLARNILFGWRGEGGRGVDIAPHLLANRHALL